MRQVSVQRVSLTTQGVKVLKNTSQTRRPFPLLTLLNERGRLPTRKYKASKLFWPARIQKSICFTALASHFPPPDEIITIQFTQNNHECEQSVYKSGGNREKCNYHNIDRGESLYLPRKTTSLSHTHTYTHTHTLTHTRDCFVVSHPG